MAAPWKMAPCSTPRGASCCVWQLRNHDIASTQLCNTMSFIHRLTHKAQQKVTTLGAALSALCLAGLVLALVFINCAPLPFGLTLCLQVGVLKTERDMRTNESSRLRGAGVHKRCPAPAMQGMTGPALHRRRHARPPARTPASPSSGTCTASPTPS